MTLAAVDLFCGIGGLTSGLEASGIPVLAGFDVDKSCEYAYRQNNEGLFFHRDLTKHLPREAREIFSRSEVSILAGCAPCQPYSNASNSRSKEDRRWTLVDRFADFVKELKPTIVTMENVPQIRTHRKGKTFSSYCDRLKNMGYSVTYYIVDSSQHGTPQRRKRLVLYASLSGQILHAKNAVAPKAKFTVREAIGHLPPLNDGETSPHDPLHRCRKLSKENIERIQYTTEGGGYWDWPQALQDKLACRSSQTGRTFKSAYGRMCWDQPAPTLTTHCTGISNGRFGHPVQNRAISLREAGLLQGFPLDYKFVDVNTEYNFGSVAKHIGNAVPPTLGYAIGKSILDHINAI